jgi:ATP-dependent protease HslVU (ClpYQ) peptidase subunit
MLEKELPRFDNQIAEELSEQKEKSIEIVKKILVDVEDIGDSVDKTLTHQKQYEQSIFEMFKDVVERAQKELQEERRDRILNHKNIFLLIENAYEKINNIK